MVSTEQHNQSQLDNKCGDSGASTLGEMLKTNTTIIMLDLEMALDNKLNCVKFFHFLEKNEMGPESGVALGNGLKENTTLTKINLKDMSTGLEASTNNLSMTINSEMKDAKELQKQ